MSIYKLKRMELKPRRVKFTPLEIARIDKNLMQSSLVFKWLTDAGYSKKKIVKNMKISHCNRYVMFQQPDRYITLERLLALCEMLPDKTITEILTGLIPEHKKLWYELDADEGNELLRKLGDKI